MTDTEVKLCKHGDGKPVHCKEECQAHYRQTARRARGLKAPGPKPDAAKPFSRYNTVTSHHRAHDRCSNGHLWVEGSYKVRSDGRKVCLVCIDENRPTACPTGHEYTPENTYYYRTTIMCKTCNRVRQVAQRLKSKYGLTVEQFEAMLVAQDMTCTLCQEEFDTEQHNGICVDHDHNCCRGQKTCGRCIRGILCCECNKKLHDDIEWHLRAIKYLNSYQLARKLKEEA